VKAGPVRHGLEYVAYRLAAAPLAAIPHGAARALGRLLGDLAWALDGRHRRVTLDNLALALPERPVAERRRIARACFRHFGRSFSDMLSAQRFDLQELCRRTTLEGWDHMLAARAAARPRGFLLITGHVGLWEHAAHAVGVYAGPLHVVGRPLDNPWLDRELAESRRRFGNHLIPKRGAARGMLRALQTGEEVALLVDQRVQPKEGVEVPFFGRPAWTTPVPARLSLRFSVPVVPAFGYPAPGGRYRVEVLPPVEPVTASADDEGAVRELTARYTGIMEAAIRRDPALWLWMHRRWKPRPGAAG
jgi:KDO2-lipid IV(A) lauroyltransferase